MAIPHYLHMNEGAKKLHLGCGGNYMPGWINIDLSPDTRADMVWDVTRGIPLESGSITSIYSEDFIEHITLEQGTEVLEECFRVLERGGFLRILTPDLLIFAKTYINREQTSLDWYGESFGTKTFGEMFNMGMRMGGHTFLYDEETLDLVLESVGFEVFTGSFNESPSPELSDLDIRGDGMSIYRDCKKPESA
ncbi:MAG: methyltransferase domain-containing protein [Acidimicrobiales bacterium]